MTEQDGIDSNFDGVLGLSRNIDPNDTEKVGPLLINQLAEKGILKHNVFAFYLESFIDEHNDRTSFVDFGTIKNEHMSDRADLIWLNMDEHFFWINSNCIGLKLGSESYLF